MTVHRSTCVELKGGVGAMLELVALHHGVTPGEWVAREVGCEFRRLSPRGHESDSDMRMSENTMRENVEASIRELKASHRDCNRRSSVAGCPWPLMSRDDVDELVTRVEVAHRTSVLAELRRLQSDLLEPDSNDTAWEAIQRRIAELERHLL